MLLAMCSVLTLLRRSIYIYHACYTIIRNSLIKFCFYLFIVTPIFSAFVTGFFGDLLSLVCQSFSMVDMVVLLHGNPQPLSRIQPELATFFNEHYLNGQEPTDANISVRLGYAICSGSLVGSHLYKPISKLK